MFQPLYLLPEIKQSPNNSEDAEMKMINEVIMIGVETIHRYMRHLKESVKREIEDLRIIVS